MYRAVLEITLFNIEPSEEHSLHQESRKGPFCCPLSPQAIDQALYGITLVLMYSAPVDREWDLVTRVVESKRIRNEPCKQGGCQVGAANIE